MKISLQYGDIKEEFLCPEEAVGCGLVMRDTFSIGDGMDRFFSDVIRHEIEQALPDGKKITFLYYTAKNPAVCDILHKYKGMPVLEFACNDIKVVATI